MRFLLLVFFVYAAGSSILTPEASADQAYQYQTGADLLHLCKTPSDPAHMALEDRARLVACGAYIKGFLSHYSLTRQSYNSTFCLPAKGTNVEQVRRLFVQLVSHKPEIRDLPAGVNLASSLTWGFPCSKKGKTSH